MKLRRAPIQKRSQQRLEVILDRAAESFADVGYEATTMEQIAERAETSIGSLYQFFPNKAEMFRALVERSTQRCQTAYDALASVDSVFLSWQDLLDQIIDGFWIFSQTEPGFRAITHNLHMIYGPFEDLHRVYYTLIISHTDARLQTLAPALSVDERQRIATMVVEVINAGFFFAIRKTRHEADSMITELKTMVRAYLSVRIPSVP